MGQIVEKWSVAHERGEVVVVATERVMTAAEMLTLAASIAPAMGRSSPTRAERVWPVVLRSAP